MTDIDSLPLVGIPCDVRTFGTGRFHQVGEKYINGVAHGAGCLPMLIPAFGEGEEMRALTGHVDLDDLVARLDGLFVTGSPSNVEPHHYGRGLDEADTLLDPQRDALTLALIERALAAGLPMFAVCRGIQELNVVKGGTLHQHVHELDGRLDHRGGEKGTPREALYALAHDVAVTPGGLLHAVTGRETLRVNTVHSQGIDDLGAGLAVEAVAPDGQIEAVSVAGAAGFALAVQWHPEWRYWEVDLYRALFRAFGEACRARAAARAARRVA